MLRRVAASDIEATDNARAGIAPAIVSLAMATTLGLGACQKAAETAGEHANVRSENPTTTEPVGEPVEIPGSLGATRAFYQSRNVVTLDVKAAALKPGEEFALTNDTTKATLIEYRESTSALYGDDGEELESHWHLLSDDIKLRLYLEDPKFKTSFAPGENKLRLFVSDDGSGRVATTTITLRDFNAFGLSTAVFETGMQRLKGFQGGFEPVANSIVTRGGQSFMATGFLSICNQ